MPVTNFTVASESDLNGAIRSIDVGGANAAANTAYAITITAAISLSADLLAVNLPNGSSLTVSGTDGHGAAQQQTIDGGGIQRGFFVYAGAVTLQDLTIQNAVARGGNGAGAGGGGAGLGGGLFVGSASHVTLSGVSLAGNAAIGGDGGAVNGSSGAGGGMGGNGGNGSGGGGGGLGLGADGGNAGASGAAGIVPGAAGGGGGAGAGGGLSGGGGGGGDNSAGTGNTGGGGGIGGGGAAGGPTFRGGDGGFGGGGGGSTAGDGGRGGFGGGGGGPGGGAGGFGGGGAGGSGPGGVGGGNGGQGGGGGLGGGGDLFVQQGGTLTIDSASFAGGMAAKGAGGSGAGDGSAWGATMLIQVAPGQTDTIAGTIADSGDQRGQVAVLGATDGGGGSTSSGGTLILTGANTYSGGTLILPGGRLAIAADNNAGADAGEVTISSGTLDLTAGMSFSHPIALSGAAAIDVAPGAVVSATAAISGSGSLAVSGGTLALGAANPIQGGVTLSGGTVALDAAGAAGSGPITFAGGATLAVANAALQNNALPNTISGFGPGGTIDLTGLAWNPTSFWHVDAATGQLSVTAGGITDVLTLAGLAITTGLSLASDGQGGTAVASGTQFNAANESDLNAIIRSIDVGGGNAASNTAYAIHLTGSISLTADLLAFNLMSGSSVTVEGTDGKGGGQVQTLDGGGAQRGFFVYSGAVTLQNLNVNNARALGGNGGSGNNGGGGGGAGLGGGLFVASSGRATLIDVSFSGDSATGGSGGNNGNGVLSGMPGAGGGGLGGSGGNTPGDGGGGNVGNAPSAGGGIGLGADGGGSSGGDGIIPGAAGGAGNGAGRSGGGGGAAVSRTAAGGGGVGAAGAAGGFGGGGGGAGGGFGNGGGQLYTSGPGGFGGGGAGAGVSAAGAGGFGGGGGSGLHSGVGGFGAANGVYNAGSSGGGGGGLGAGGDIFVQQGASLTIEGGSLGRGSVSGGASYPGRAYGDAVFIQGDQDVVLAPAAGQTVTIAGVIADMTGSADASGQQGLGRLVVDGPGRTVLAPTFFGNSFAGGVLFKQGLLELDGGIGFAAGTGAVTFASQTGLTLKIDGGGLASVIGFGGDDKLDFASAPIAQSNVSFSDHKLTVSFEAPSGPANVSINMPDVPDGTAFALLNDGAGGTFVITEESSEPPICFCRGTRILTAHGEIPVERLEVGDRVRTLSGILKPIVWIGCGYSRLSRANKLARPIIVTRSALADGVPTRDLYLTHGHALYFADLNVMVAVEHLVNHRTIRWDEEAQAVEYYHIELDGHDVLIADGAPAESYYDAGNRAWFRSTRPRSAAGSATAPCVPVLTEGDVVEELWARLFARAGAPIVSDTTDDPDLHLLADGVRHDPLVNFEGCYSFLAEGPIGSLRLRSRSGVPSLLGHGRADHRPLGVAITQVVLEHGDIPVCFDYDQPQFREGGCYSPENGFSWTDGDYELPARFLPGAPGPVRLTVHTRRHGIPYPAEDEVASLRSQ